MDNHPSILPSPASATPPVQPTHYSSNNKGELTKVTQEIYERNVELAIRNRTLLILRKMYEIMNISVGVVETAQKLIEAIVTELKFRKVTVALIDKKGEMLQAIATYPDDLTETGEAEIFGIAFKQLKISLEHTENFAVSAAIHKQTRMTNELYDILVPLVDQRRAIKLQNILNIQTSIIFPLVFGGESLGVIIIGMEKHIGSLSRAERETLKELIEVFAIALERAQIYADLQRVNEQLKIMDQLKDEFVSVTSHELRTPMTAIKSYAWMVLHEKAGPIEPKAREYISRVFLSTERLINLVNDMLDVSRIESGKVQLKINSFDIVKLAYEIQQEFQARAAERQLTFEVSCESEIAQVLADREKIQQVLENLVGNSFKFTPAGGKIRVSIKLTDSMIQTSISDTGKGISPEDQKRLFTKFGRLSNSLVSISEAGGTGLGLYICKQYIELLKGKIRVESEVGKGTTFTFTLPRAA